MPYIFTNDWFNNTARENWNYQVPRTNPTRILEIGSYEGAATCFLIEKLGNSKPLEIYCVDTWEGGFEHKLNDIDMSEVESHFDDNIKYAQNKVKYPPFVTKLKGYSESELMKLYLDGKKGYFDFIYIDGSHETIDVLSDAILAFKLLKVNGVIAFDDYLWESMGSINLDYFPKIAIDAFTTTHANKIDMVCTINTQIFIHKIGD